MLLEKYQKLLSKDIEYVISYIFDNYQVLQNGNTVDKNMLIEHFLSKNSNIIQRCCGVLNSGVQCNRSAMKESMYCKTHYLKNQKNQSILNNNTSNIIFVEEKQQKVNEQSNELSNLTKIFIDNSLFLSDKTFIYDHQTFEKVGYIDNKEYILTSDPFILNSF